MAEPLKHFFDRTLVSRLGASLRSAQPDFPEQPFVSEAARGLDRMELMDRARHIARALRAHLPADYERACGVLHRSLGAPLAGTDAFGLAVFFYLPHVLFVAEYGLDHFEASMALQRELTRRFSAEFSIRAYLERHPEATLERLKIWALDPDPHVRRLVSEGTRPRLPWAPRLRAFQLDPAPVLALLELLRDDPVEYVRRSVANNLNDIGKDHPEVLLATCERWIEGATPERQRLIAHALRSSIKKGDPRAMAVLGFSARPRARVEAAFSPAQVRIGGSVALTVTVQSEAPRHQRLVVDLAVFFLKASGEARPKVFKLRNVELAPDQALEISKTLSFRQHSTRKHYPGEHRLQVLINGAPFEAGAIVVAPATRTG
ncbi:MAG: DNA alkylation repair protein [Polyangiaceae bacterium]|jgi:3-methyladenine DNA glycosylase AlkC|nr:DNA alkylation repair protein [Polyangiaceae bacterium]